MFSGLPDFEFIFEFDVKGQETKKRYIGEFIYKKPNLKASSEIAKYKTRLDGDLKNLDSYIKSLHQMLAQLRFGIIKFPEWWEESDFGLELYDWNIIIELYKKIMEFEDKFEKDVSKKVNEVTNKKEEDNEEKQQEK